MHAAPVSVPHLFLSRCDEMMQMQQNAAALAWNENFHLKNLAAGLFLWQLIKGPAETGHWTAQNLLNFQVWDKRSGVTSGSTSPGRSELLTSVPHHTFKEKDN